LYLSPQLVLAEAMKQQLMKMACSGCITLTWTHHLSVNNSTLRYCQVALGLVYDLVLINHLNTNLMPPCFR